MLANFPANITVRVMFLSVLFSDCCIWCTPWFYGWVLLGVLGLGIFAFLVATLWHSRKVEPGFRYWEIALKVFIYVVMRCRYRFQVSGQENVPRTGGVMLASNHVTYLDAALVPAMCMRPVHMMAWAAYENSPIMSRITRMFRAILVSSTRAKDAIRLATEKLQEGKAVGIFPEGQLSRDSSSMAAFQGGCELIARKAGVPVVPVYIDGMRGSFFGYSRGKPFQKWPRWGRPSVTILYGKPIFPTKTKTVRDHVAELGAIAYARRAEFRGHIGHAMACGLARFARKEILVDRSGPTRAPFSGALLLALARWCSRDWKKTVPENRVGIVLPPGVGAFVANIACVMAGKSPVNLNFTLGRAQVEACIAKTDLKTFVTAGIFREKLGEKFPDFPWDSMERIIDIAEVLKGAPKWRLALLLGMIHVLPGRLLCRLWGVPDKGGDAEAAVLCTSGSSGLPKGVPLTHANILGNCCQFSETGIVPENASLLGNLPIFHSFGFTVSLWFALSNGIRVVTTPSPIEVARNISAIREEKVSILIGTPTFFRSYMKKASREDMASVQVVVAGAEKTPANFAEEWESRFDSRYFEGYGATETTPVVGVNLFDVVDKDAFGGVFVRGRLGSIGRMLPGMAARFTSPIDSEPTPSLEGGVLWLKGVNVFPGYINDPERTKEALTEDGWYCTGDLARLDNDGFLFIEGRQARFSKIGGEMVPHGTVEDAIRRVLGLHFGDDMEQRIAIASREDDAKGESLVLLTTIEVNADKLRADLVAEGLSNLWIPKIIRRVEKIPVLATGKLDLQGLKELAKEQ
ncbi:MAG: AMP-binding protein [Puniceicoccales bacterium]|jgi:acyl-[acyl-carrier-protein]-phospholipid O-acyltransferase/long-chain-fatty-acid--[acyl-carrier-protein] ligase|nr:AMP-binding protein [Puniceicoccales bacterium]